MTEGKGRRGETARMQWRRKKKGEGGKEKVWLIKVRVEIKERNGSQMRKKVKVEKSAKRSKVKLK